MRDENTNPPWAPARSREAAEGDLSAEVGKSASSDRSGVIRLGLFFAAAKTHPETAAGLYRATLEAAEVGKRRPSKVN